MKINLQLFATYPVHNNIFKIDLGGRLGPANLVVIKDLESFSPGFDNNIEEWTPMDQEGWVRRMLTGRSLTIGFTGKRNHGDPGNDYIAENCLVAIGTGVESKFEWTMPSGAKLFGDCIVNVTSTGGGDSSNVEVLEFEIQTDGKPTFTPNAALELLTFVCADGVAAGATKIDAVVPVLTGGNSYLYKVNGALPVLNEDLTDKGWAAYVLGADIPVVNGNTITLIEVAAGDIAKKGGQSASVVA